MVLDAIDGQTSSSADQHALEATRKSGSDGGVKRGQNVHHIWIMGWFKEF
jgi:hypothetical protein